MPSTELETTSDPSFGSRGYQIIEDVLSAAESDEATNFFSKRQIPLTRKHVVKAVRLGIHSGLITFFQYRNRPQEQPIKVGFMPMKGQEIKGVLFDQAFVKNSTPEQVAFLIQEGKIKPWEIARKMFTLVKDELVIE